MSMVLAMVRRTICLLVAVALASAWIATIVVAWWLIDNEPPTYMPDISYESVLDVHATDIVEAL